MLTRFPLQLCKCDNNVIENKVNLKDIASGYFQLANFYNNPHPYPLPNPLPSNLEEPTD